MIQPLERNGTILYDSMAPGDSNVIGEIFQKCLVPRIWGWEKWEKSWKIIFFEKNYKSLKSFKNTLKRIFRGT